jgi:4-hydroxy-tetrahydrodipicolinate synthase
MADNGLRFLQPCAGMGQYMEISREEYRRMLEISVDEIGDRVFITAYVAHSDPRQTIELINLAEDAGAHAAFLMQPFFTKPADEGVFLYFKAVAEGTKLPLVLYNCPSRAIINMSVGLMDRITDEVPNFVGLKQTNINEFPEAVRRLTRKFKVMPCAEDQMLFGFALGSLGVLSFSANIIPDCVVAIQTAWESGDHDKARDIYLEWLPLFNILHIEPVPNAVVYVLNRMGWDFGPQRIPAHEPSEEHNQKIDGVLLPMTLISQ